MHTFAVRDGIVDFRWTRRDYYFNPVPRVEMAKLITNARTVPWDETVRGFLRFANRVPDWIDNIAVNSRYAWKLMLELPADGRFLDYGCGLGNLTHNVAPHVAQTVALDLTWERLQFARERFAKFNVDDRITLVAGGDGQYLPFPDGHFDCIALSGVLEWIADDIDVGALEGGRWRKGFAMLASSFGKRNPRKTQLRFLRELARILKPGGQLFVGIENRWGYEYFVGRPDHHSGLPLGSLLPRLLANAYSIARNHRPYRTYTHTFRGMRRLFAEAGMSHQEIYGLTPGYSHLAEVVPAWTHQPFWHPRRAARIVERIQRSRHFVPAFGMIAQTQGSSGVPMIARLLVQLGERGALQGVRLRECLVTGKDKVVLRVEARLDSTQGTREVFVKIPSDDTSRAGERRNAEVLAELARRGESDLLVPLPVAQGVLQELEWYAETGVAGAPIARAQGALPRGRLTRNVGEFVHRLGAGRHRRAQVGQEHPLYQRLVVDTPLKLIQGGADEAACAAIAQAARTALVDRTWVLAPVHGDLSVSNVFVEGDRISGVIDWEYSSDEGLPVLDFLAHLESRQRLDEPRSSYADSFNRLARRDWPCRDELDTLEALYTEFEIEAPRHRDLCLLAALSHIEHRLRTATRFNPSFATHAVAGIIGLCADGLSVE